MNLCDWSSDVCSSDLLWRTFPLLCYILSAVSRIFFGGVVMSKNKHLSLDDRSKIQLMLDNKESFSSIASSLGKDPSTISKEIRNHLQYRKVGAYHLPYNSCTKRVSCPKSHICTECHAARKYTLCRRCSMCNSLCKDFEKETCKRLLKPPYVCNGCGDRKSVV